MSAPPISLPLHTTVSIISKCNLNCVYCYAQPFNGTVMPKEDAMQLLRQLRDDGVFMIKLAGGEPLLHPDIFEILEFIARERIPVALLTNGTVHRGDDLTRLANILVENRFIDFQVSLDSVDFETNDYLRGLTEQAVETIDFMTERGIDVQIATVLTSKNVASVEEMIGYFFPRVRKFHFMNLMPTPRAISTYQELALPSTELEDVWSNQIRKLSERFGEGLVLSAEEHLKDATEDDREISCESPGCLAGVTFVDIDANMDVLACNCANAFKIGNLYDASLSEIWHSKLADRVRAVGTPLCHLYREAAIDDGLGAHGENELTIVPLESLLDKAGV